MPFTASNFASWVFNKEVGHYRQRAIGRVWQEYSGEQHFDWEKDRMHLGYLSHYEIEEMRRNHFPYGWKADDKKLWSVDYWDTGENSEILKSSILRNSTDGRKLRGKPDLVLTNNNDHHVVIIERKTTKKSSEELRWGSSDAATWPNCQAQLWSYAHLDRYVSAPRIFLILQPWFRDQMGNHTMGETTPPRVFEKGSEFDRQNLRRFEAYGGVRSG